METQLRKRYFSFFFRKRERERERAICFERFFGTAFWKVLWEISALENTCGFAKVCAVIEFVLYRIFIFVSLF